MLIKYKNGNSLENRSKYSYRIDGNFIEIIDCGGMKSVTYDMENVLDYIGAAEQIDLSNYYIVYRCVKGIWEGVYYCKNKLIFIPMDETDVNRARDRVKQIIKLPS